MDKQKQLSQDFAQHHPEIGEIKSGVVLSAETIQLFALVILRKMKGIEHSAFGRELLPEENSFILRTADMGSRCLKVALEKDSGALQTGVVKRSLELIQKRASLSAQAARSPLADRFVADLDSPNDVDRMLDATSALAQSNLPMNAHVSNLVDIGVAAFNGLAGVAQYNGGVEIDRYLEGNLQNILAQYEMVKQASIQQ